MAKREENTLQLDLETTPIGWVELARLFQVRDMARIEWEQAKAAVKGAKADLEMADDQLSDAGRRVAHTAREEARTIRDRGMANRRVDPATGEIRG